MDDLVMKVRKEYWTARNHGYGRLDYLTVKDIERLLALLGSTPPKNHNGTD